MQELHIPMSIWTNLVVLAVAAGYIWLRIGAQEKARGRKAGPRTGSALRR